ncbi:hypothetical protein GCM10028799_75070 [Kribbella italica]
MNASPPAGGTTWSRRTEITRPVACTVSEDLTSQEVGTSASPLPNRSSGAETVAPAPADSPEETFAEPKGAEAALAAGALAAGALAAGALAAGALAAGVLSAGAPAAADPAAELLAAGAPSTGLLAIGAPSTGLLAVGAPSTGAPPAGVFAEAEPAGSTLPATSSPEPGGTAVPVSVIGPWPWWRRP